MLVVKVDRSVRPVYPDWVKDILHPRLERKGPLEFHLRTGLNQWLHGGQKNGGGIIGSNIYGYLKNNGMLSSRLNLQDGLAIQAKGIVIFRKLFQERSLFLWKSVVCRDDGRRHVPYLFGDDGRIVIHWCWFDATLLEDSDPALRFSCR